jgi:hypothetical protein
MQLKIPAILAVATLGVAGCGSSAASPKKSSEQRRVADLARKCGESEVAVVANVKALLRVTSAHGIHATPGEATDLLEKTVDYAERRKAAPDCKTLLAVLATVAQHPPKGHVCFGYGTGRFCVAPPLKE